MRLIIAIWVLFLTVKTARGGCNPDKISGGSNLKNAVRSKLNKAKEKGSTDRGLPTLAPPEKPANAGPLTVAPPPKPVGGVLTVAPPPQPPGGLLTIPPPKKPVLTVAPPPKPVNRLPKVEPPKKPSKPHRPSGKPSSPGTSGRPASTGETSDDDTSPDTDGLPGLPKIDTKKIGDGFKDFLNKVPDFGGDDGKNPGGTILSGIADGLGQIGGGSGRRRRRSTDSKSETKTLLENFGALPGTCRVQIADTLKQGDCGSEDARRAMCDDPDSRGITNFALRCLRHNDKCPVLEDVVNDCIPEGPVRCRYGKKMMQLDCNTDRVDVRALACPDNKIYLNDIELPELRRMLRRLSEIAGRGKATTCEAAASLKGAINNHYTSIDNQAFSDLLPLLPYLDEDTCRLIPVKILKSRLEEISNLGFDCRPAHEQLDDLLKQSEERSHHYRYHRMRCVHNCGQILAKRLTEGTNPAISVSKKADVDRLGDLAECLPSSSAEDLARSGSCKAAKKVVGDDARKSDRVVDLCRPDKPLDEYTSTDVKEMGDLFFDMKPKSLEKVPRNVLCDKETLDANKKNKDSKLSVDRLFSSMCVEDGEKLTAEKIKDLGGPVVLSSPLSALKDLDTETLKDNDIADTIIDGAKKISSEKGRDSSARLNKLAEKVSQEKETLTKYMNEKSIMKGINALDFGNIVGSVEEVVKNDPDLSDAQNRVMIDKIKKQPFELTAKDIKELKSLSKGFTCDEVKDMNPDERLDIAFELCRIEGWKGKMPGCITDLLEKGLKDINETNYMKKISVDDVNGMSTECLVKLEAKELEAAEPVVCKGICARIGRGEKLPCFMSPQSRTRIRDTCIKCLDKEEKELEDDDVQTLGKLLQTGLGEAIDKIPNSVFRRHVGLFRRGCMNTPTISKLQSKINSAIGDKPDEVDVSKLGEHVSLLSDVAKSGVAEEIGNHAADIAADVEAGRDDEDEDDDEGQCCRNEMSLPDLEFIDLHQEETLELASESYMATTVEERRKRSTRTLYCNDVENMRSSVSTRSVDEIRAMDNTEFSNCLQTFAAVKTWNKEQRKALLEKVKVGVGPLCELTDSQLQQLGSMALAMTTSDIQCLHLEKDGAVSDLGGMKSWSEEQLEALANRFMALRPNLKPATLTSDHISTMGYILCGLSPEAIRQIPHAVYRTSSAAIGLLKKCPCSRLRALKDLATHSKVFGPVPGWGPAKYSNIGIVLGGLTGGELSTADTADIEGWRVHGISHIHASELKHMTVNQLRSFSRVQAGAVSAKQRIQLSLDQKNALLLAQNGDDAVLLTDGNGAVTVGISTILLVTCAAVWRWIQ